MLKLFRKIFGCWHDPEFDIGSFEEDEAKENVISGIVSGVISAKEKSFVSYNEDAMDGVTEGKFRFKKYRP